MSEPLWPERLILDGERAPISFDLDGVLSRPPLGLNLGISRTLDLAPPPTSAETRRAALGDDAPLLGAAELAFERLLADPLDVS